jgi:hypothetical protein
MCTRRAVVRGLGGMAFAPKVMAASSPRLALLFSAPWKGETWLGNGVSRVSEALRARSFGPADTIASAEPLDRGRLLRRLDEVKRRIANWRQGDLFLHYDGHGMYERGAGPVPEAGLQLTGDRDDPSSRVLWREVWEALQPPPGVRVVALPDCCHTNLLAGRLPRNVSAIIMKSEPQDTLSCRTGGGVFGEGAARKRYGVITYYAATTLAAASTLADWLAAIDAEAERDMAAGRLARPRRVPLMIEGDGAARLPGRPAARGI